MLGLINGSYCCRCSKCPRICWVTQIKRTKGNVTLTEKLQHLKPTFKYTENGNFLEVSLVPTARITGPFNDFNHIHGQFHEIVPFQAIFFAYRIFFTWRRVLLCHFLFLKTFSELILELRKSCKNSIELSQIAQQLVLGLTFYITMVRQANPGNEHRHNTLN